MIHEALKIVSHGCFIHGCLMRCIEWNNRLFLHKYMTIIYPDNSQPSKSLLVMEQLMQYWSRWNWLVRFWNEFETKNDNEFLPWPLANWEDLSRASWTFWKIVLYGLPLKTDLLNCSPKPNSWNLLRVL